MTRYRRRSSLGLPAPVLVLLALLAACGSGSTPTVAGATVPVPARASATTGDPKVAGTAITAFGVDLLGAARAGAPAGNLSLSPTSVAVALGMLEPGAVDQAKVQLDRLLHLDDPAAFHAGVNALTQDLTTRQPDRSFDKTAELTLRLANAAYLQKGYPFEAAYLAAIGANYGPVLSQVDFAAGPDKVAHQINQWVAGQTADRIKDLIADGQLQPDTVLALVNALYLKASWQEPFTPAATADAPFTRADGSTVTVPMMRASGSSSARGDGWVGATKRYSGGLEAQFILPDKGRFDEVASNLGAVLAAYDAHRLGEGPLGLPRFTTRTSAELSPALQRLGLTAPYGPGQLKGIAPDDRLVLDQVIHQTWLAMDEKGTEAAAATAVIARATSAPAQEPVSVVLDRPFLWRIVDTRSGATLFLGQILDPTA